MLAKGSYLFHWISSQLWAFFLLPKNSLESFYVSLLNSYSVSMGSEIKATFSESHVANLILVGFLFCSVFLFLSQFFSTQGLLG